MILLNTGILLIADPFLKDPNFLRSVVLLCDYNENEGSIGFVLNNKITQTLDEIFDQFKGFKIPVYFGGPVQTDSIHFIHQYPDLIPGSVKVTNDIYWGGNFETLIILIKNNSINLNKIKFFIGYSGWSKNQLNVEINEKTWLTSTANIKIAFNTADKEIWKASCLQLGAEYENIVNYPIDPQLN